MHQQNTRLNNKNIFLIGMMGSWKSTIGNKLAHFLNYKYIDTDLAIEKMMKMKISKIFSEYGEEKFRYIEESYFVEKSKDEGFVFSTGGGIVLRDKSRMALKNNGITILLKASIKTIYNRIKTTNEKPLLNNQNDTIITLEKIWLERKNFYYDNADFIVDTDKLQPDQVIEEILKLTRDQIEKH